MDVYVGAIVMFAGNYAPKGWMMLQGQSLSTSQYQTLFAIFGYQYGGSGANFNLPDLRGRVPAHCPAGVNLGTTAGAETVALTATTMPSHVHTANVTSLPADTNQVTDAYPANLPTDVDYSTTSNAVMADGFITTQGAGLPHANMQPYTVINYITPANGLFPTRN